MRLIVLAAGQGTRLRPLTDDRPKCLVEVAGRSLLDWQLDAGRRVGISDAVVVGGYHIERLADRPVRLIANPEYASTNMVRTLFCARDLFGDSFVMSYGDIAYSSDILRAVVESKAPISVAVDRAWRPYWERRFDDPLSDAETLTLDGEGHITDIGQKPKRIEDIMAQYIGLVAFRGQGVRALLDAYAAAEDEGGDGSSVFGSKRSLDKLYMTDLLQGLIRRGEKLTAVKIDGGWVEVDSQRDLAVAEELIHAGRFQVQP